MLSLKENIDSSYISVPVIVVFVGYGKKLRSLM